MHDPAPHIGHARLTGAPLCLSLVLGLVLGPSPVLASPPDDEDTPAASDGQTPPAEGPELGPGEVLSADEVAPEDPILIAAKSLYDAGVARYTAADYEGAVDLWLQAFALLPPTTDNQLIKAQLIYNVARAQQKWFDIDRDVRHLRQSKEILTRYLDDIDALYGPEEADSEHEKINARIADLALQIADWEAGIAQREAELAERMRPKFDDQADAREARRNKSMVGAGAALTALGLGGGTMLIIGVVMGDNAEIDSGLLPLEEDIPERERVIARGQLGNGLTVGGILGATVFLAAGVPLLVVGLRAEKQRAQRRRDARLEARVDVASPIFVRGGMGIGVSGRF